MFSLNLFFSSMIFSSIRCITVLKSSSDFPVGSSSPQLSSNALKQAYNNRTDLLDQTEISDDAIAKYEQEQEIRKYKDIVLNMLKLDETSSNSKADEIKDLIENNNFEVDEKTLADVLAKDDDFLSMLF